MDYLGGVGFCRKNFRVLSFHREASRALVRSVSDERDRQYEQGHKQCAEHEEHRIEIGKVTYLHGLSRRESARPAARGRAEPGQRRHE